MKKIFIMLCVLFSMTALAENNLSVWPQVYNYGRNVQVQVWNHTDNAVNCSGPIYMTMEDGTTDHEYYFDYVSPRFSSFRTIYPHDFNARISHVSHSIWCR